MRPGPTPGPQSLETAALPIWEGVGIVDLNAQGEGVGRHEGQVVFVPFTIPGEIADIRVLNQRQSFARGELQNLRGESTVRAVARCQHFGVCGVCQYQHIRYPAQAEIAADSVMGNLRKLMKNWHLPEPTVLTAGDGYGYRTQARLQFTKSSEGRYSLGYTANDGAAMPVAECPILAPVLQSLLGEVLAWLATDDAHAQLARLDMRFLTLQSNHDSTQAGLKFHTFELLNLGKHYDEEYWGDLWLAWQTAVPALTGLVIDNGRSDRGFGANYTEETGQLAPAIPIGAFKQNHPVIERRLYESILGWLEPGARESGLDAYCGRGELTARLALQAREGRVTGVESDPAWFDESGTHINHEFLPEALRPRISFVRHTVDQWLTETTPTVDWAVFNPPRKGMEPPVLDWLRESHRGRWLYLSCNPATFARDCQALGDAFQLQSLAIADMFPQTAKMELLASFHPS